MTYVTANLHGAHADFTKLLKIIKFKESDLLYILGDVVDYGEEPIGLVCDISMRYNVYTIAGEHDFMAARMLSGFEKMLGSGGTPDRKFIAEMNAWVADGGKSTLEGFRALDDEMKEGVIDYLSDMLLYEEIKIGGREYLLVHSGLGGLEMGRSDPGPAEMFVEPIDFSRRYFADKTVIAGHIPTSDIPGGQAGKVFRGEGCIGVDCGAARGGRIGCLRLEDGREFYV